MQNSISTNKIIIFVVFVCAALMTSVFVFHMSRKATPITLADNSGTFFPVAREIKSFDLVAGNNQKFSLNDLRGHWTILFFGFTHCGNVCPMTLEMLNRAYTQLQPNYPHLRVVLISVDPERDTPEKLLKYTQSFNKDFIGVTGKIQELRKLQSQLGIFSARDDSNSTNYQIQHTSSILLINPQGKWVGIFKYGMTPTQFAQAFSKGVTSLQG